MPSKFPSQISVISVVKNKDAVAITGLTAAVLLFLWPLAFTDRILARGDTFLYFYPYWQAATDALRAGRLPLWNPHIFMGAPLLANSQMGFFYPLNRPLWALFSVPVAVKATLVGHVWLAAMGTYAWLRRSVRVDPLAAAVGAGTFALGGYMLAQAEHINQVQGLAWLPWLLWATHSGHSWRRTAAWLSLFFGLQLLAGHTQTTFISGVVVGGWGVLTTADWRGRAARVGAVAVGAVTAVLLAAVQLWPTLELMGLSSRQAGLTFNEVLSFSLSPLLVGRALLPLYGESLFTEYVAFVPLTAVLLAVSAGWRWRERPRVTLVLILFIVGGLWLALGRFGGLYLLLGRLPGFNLFRVPARWLVVYGLGLAGLTAVGVDRWRRQVPGWQPITAGLLLIGAVAAVNVPAVWAADLVPALSSPEAPVVWPGRVSMVGWGIELVLFLAGWLFLRRDRARWAVVLVGMVALYAGTRPLPLNNLTAPTAYTSQRPPSLRLQAETAAQTAPARFLSLSEIFFDPGDTAELQTVYGDQLSTAAFYDYIVAAKAKEIVAPNLPMVYRTPSLDGFDGGILPLRSYSDLMAATVLDGTVTTDGRLREQLTAVPAAEWLDVMQVGYLITDKVGDAWVDGVYYDRQHPAVVRADRPVAVGDLPPFAADEIRVLAETAGGRLRAHWMVAGETRTADLELTAAGDNVWAAQLPIRTELTAVTLTVGAGAAEWPVQAVTLTDAQTGTFQPLVLGAYRLIHSGDVKIYENMDVGARAFWVADVDRWPPQNLVAAEVVVYEAEQVEIAVPDGVTDGWLIITDAHYPGWTAVMDGRPAETAVYADFFRAVRVPAGARRVVWSLGADRVRTGARGSLLGAAVVVALFWRRRR